MCNRKPLQCIFIFFVRKFYNLTTLVDFMLILGYFSIFLQPLVPRMYKKTLDQYYRLHQNVFHIETLSSFTRLSFNATETTLSRTQQKLVEIPNAERVGVFVFFVFANNHRRCLKCCSHCIVSSKKITEIKDNFCYTRSSFTVFTVYFIT